MSEESVERAKEAYAALGHGLRSGDLDPFFREYVHPEIEWVPLEGALDVDVSVGLEATKARVMAILDAIGEPELEAEEIIDAGEKLVVAIRIAGRGRGSGIDMESNWFHVLTEQDQKLLRLEWYATRAEALEAAGLPG